MIAHPHSLAAIRALSLAWLLVGAGSSAHAHADVLDLSSYLGKVVYIDFWASWCGPCRHSFPWMKRLNESKAGEGLVILAVNLDQEPRLAREFLDEFNPNFRILYDRDASIATAFDVMGMPSAYIIGRDGKARYKHVGFHESKEAQYEKEIQTLLDEKPGEEIDQ